MSSEKEKIVDLVNNNLKGALIGVSAFLAVVTLLFLYASRDQEFPHVTVVSSYAMLTLLIVCVIILIAFSIYDSRVDRIIDLTNTERDSTVKNYSKLVDTLQSNLDASSSRDVARFRAESQNYTDKAPEDIKGWTPVSSTTENDTTNKNISVD